MNKLVITLTGPYTEDDICRFSALMREIERRSPTELFTMIVDDGSKGTLEDAERLIRKAFVPVSGEEPIFKAIPNSELERP